MDRQCNAISVLLTRVCEEGGCRCEGPASEGERPRPEGDVATKRNAFLMLFNCAQDRAVRYLRKVLPPPVFRRNAQFVRRLATMVVTAKKNRR